MQTAERPFYAHCFDKTRAARNGYGAFFPTVLCVFGIVALGCAAWFIDPYLTLGAVLCAVGLVAFLVSLVLLRRRQKARLTAYAVGADHKVYRVSRTGYRGVGLYAAGEATGQLADTLLGGTAGSDIGSLAGGIAGIVSVNKLTKAMGTPSIIEAMLTNPDAVHGASLIRINGVNSFTPLKNGCVLRYTGVSAKTGKGFANKRIRIPNVYTEQEALQSALEALRLPDHPGAS